MATTPQRSDRGQAIVSAPVSSPAASALTHAAMALLSSARSHKRASRLHRTAAADCMQQLDDLKRQAAAAGIQLEIQSEEGNHLHGQRHSNTRHD